MKFFSKIIAVAFMLAGATQALAQFTLPSLPSLSSKEADKLNIVEITAFVASKSDDIDKCRAEHKKKEPKVSGELLAHFVVEPSGKASRLTILSTEFTGSTFAICLSGLVGAWTFPQRKERSSAFNLVQKF